MIVKLKDIINSEQSLKKLLDTKLPIKTSYWIGKIINKIQPELKVFDESKMALFKKLGVPTEDSPIVNGVPQNWKLLEKNLPEFQEEIAKLLDVDVDLGDIKKFKLEDFGETNLEPSVFLPLEWIIE